MATPRARAIGVGAFVIGGLVLFSVGLFLIGDRRMLFRKTFEVRSQFSRISGLQSGAKVRVAGLDAGEVDGDPRARRAQREVRRRDADSRRLSGSSSVRTRSASIQNDGLVGNKFVQIEAGTDSAPIVADGGIIVGEEPFDIADLLQKMSDTIDVANDTIASVRTELEDVLTSVTATAQSAQTLVNEASGDVRAIAASSHKATADVATIVANLRAGRGSVGKLLTDDAFYKQVRDISDQAQKAVANLREASEKAKEAIADLRGENGPMKGMTGDLSQTLEYARDAMQDLAENTEALKHNVFFRGYFNRRGYFDLGDISVQQYRSGVLEQAGRVPLRIWLQSAVLFAPDTAGKEILTEAGRARIESAMGMFVRYPKDSPLVIEGYGADVTGDQQFLLSRSRAALVKAYVVSRFGVDPGLIAEMPMGAEAVHGPSGDTWDGVALALFVSKSAFAEPKPVAQGLIDHK